MTFPGTIGSNFELLVTDFVIYYRLLTSGLNDESEIASPYEIINSNALRGGY